MIPPPPVTTRCALCCALALLPAVTGCRVDVTRVRAGNPLSTEEYEKLEVGKTTRGETLQRLGAPEKVEWKNGDDYFWYLYSDTLDTAVRFQFPPFRSVFGYQHNILRLSEDSTEVNALQLVFDEDEILQHKSLRLSEAYGPGPAESSRKWRMALIPYVEHSFLLLGDAGIRDYADLFENGFRAGLDIGYQPVPVLRVFVGANYQEYQGDTEATTGGALAFDDLHLYQFYLGVRVSLPLALFLSLGDFESVKRVLFDEDPEGARGLRLYVQGFTGGTLNDEVPVKTNGVPSGNFYDRDVGFSGGLGGGIEYSWGWGAAYAGIQYESTDAFNEGNSPLDDEGSAFEALLVGGGLSFQF